MTRELRGFTRKEAIEVTGCTSNQLQSFERAKLVVPRRVEKTGKPTVLYSRSQLLEIKAIKQLREQISLQKVKRIIQFLNDHGFGDNLNDKQLVIIDNDVFWVSVDWADFPQQMPKALKVLSKRRKEIGQYCLIIIPPLINLAQEIIRTARKSKVIDFPSFMERFDQAA
jgi:DNA-binding transcriptional MerR regulator